MAAGAQPERVHLEHAGLRLGVPTGTPHRARWAQAWGAHGNPAQSTLDSGLGCPRELCKQHARPSSGRPQEPLAECARPGLRVPGDWSLA